MNTTTPSQTGQSTSRRFKKIPTFSEIDQKANNIGMSTKNVSTGLGLFSLALGLTEVFMTRGLARTSGFQPQHETTLKVFGFREMTSGVGLLAGSNQKTWMWSRVIGDALDVAFMGYAFAKAETPQQRKRLTASALAVAPIILLDIANALRASQASNRA